MNKKYISLLLLGSFAIASAAITGTIYPTSDGAYVQWTPSTGSTHYTLVDEAACNGTTDYVRTTTVGNRDSFSVSLSSVPDGSTITSVTITPCASRNTNKTSVMNVFYRIDGVNSADQGAYALTGTTPINLTGTTYSGLSIIKGATTSLEIGAVLTSGNGGARLSRLATSITYTPTLPVAPSSLSVTASSSSLYLTWADNSNNESSFRLEKGTDGVNFSLTGVTSSNVAFFNDASTTPGVTYYYRVYATNETGTSSYSNIASGSRP